MTSISLVAANCGRVKRGENRGFSDLGPHNSYSSKFLLAPDLLRSSKRCCSSNGLGDSRVGKPKRFSVVAKVKKGRSHDYPWPDDIDPNITTGHLTYLSYFKPLAEKPKQVTLPFEKPLIDLEKKIIEVRRMADDTGLDFSDQIGALEEKYQQALKDLYTHLSPIQRLTIARHPNRPTALDHIFNITEKWVELHGDRAGYDDPAIVTGIGSIDGKSYLFIGHQKGRNTKENIARNFAMPTPHGYRKALRMMKYADHHSLPIVTFVDTPGAFADLKSEELGQGEAIAHNLRTMFGLKVPIVTVVTGEGGSGGALAIACANKLLMLENSAFYVASPEACAAILWKSSKAAPKAAERLKITAQEHYRLGIADGIIPEPLGGAHADPMWTSQQIKLSIKQAMEELTKLDTKELLHHRMRKFRTIGGWQEGVPVDPKIKRNMKPSDLNMLKAADIELELEDLKKKIFDSKPQPEPITTELIKKLKQDVDQEITKAFISMGLNEKLESIQLELSKSSNPNLKEKADKLMQEFQNKFSQPGAYLGLKQKLAKLNMVNTLVQLKQKSDKLEKEINKTISEEVKIKLQAAKDVQEKLLKGDPLDDDSANKLKEAKNAVMEVLRSAGLEIVAVTKKKTENPPRELIEKMVNVDKEIREEIAKVVATTGLDRKIEELKDEIVKRNDSTKIESLEGEIKERILDALDVTALKEKVNNLTGIGAETENGRL